MVTVVRSEALGSNRAKSAFHFGWTEVNRAVKWFLPVKSIRMLQLLAETRLLTDVTDLRRITRKGSSSLL